MPDALNQTPQLPETVDVAIVGGGMVGLSLAAVIAGNSALRVAVIEAFPMADLTQDAAVDQLPPSFDARASALSESSRRIYQQIGLWESLARWACPITAIHVSDRGHAGATRLNANEAGVPGLGYVIENRALGRVLGMAASRHSNLSLHAPLRVDRLTPMADGMAVHVGDDSCKAALVVAAGGADSGLLQSLGIHTDTRDYGQTALIANVALDRCHGGVAYERFTDEGPIALLPLPATASEHRAALVWTLAPERADQLADAGEAEFLQTLHRRFGFRAGRFLRCGARATYPLKLMMAQEQVRRHLVVAGNAAHFLHPVAGQGFNLALRDVARLSEEVLAGVARGRSPGDLALLESYREKQQRDQYNTIRFSHSLPTLFGDASAPVAALRNAGLVALDLIEPLRHEFANFGAGLFNPDMKLARPT